MRTVFPGVVFHVACMALTAVAASAYEISGVVLDAKGAPIEGASVWLSQQRITRVGTSDRDGRFHFEDLVAAPVDIVARKEGLALWGVQGQVIDDAEVTITLRKGEAIQLRIINTQYEPIAGARLKRLEVEGSFRIETEDLVPLGFPSYRSDSDGNMTIEGVPWGTFIGITVSHHEYAEAMLPAVPAGIGISMPMLYGVKLLGRVTNEAGDGVERARISVFRTMDGKQREFSEVLSDREGFYTANVPAGSYFVAARHHDYAMPRPLPVQLRNDGEDAIIDLTLPAPHHIVGTTVDTEGAPVAMARLSYRSGDFIYDEAISDVLGEFQLTVASGSGVLQIAAPRRMITVGIPRIFFEIGDEPVVNIKPIELKALPVLTGRIAAEGDVPLDKILISSLNLDPPVWATTDENGAFRIELEWMYDMPMRFRAEHALRFLRRDFEVDPIELESPEVRLRAYRPALETDDRPGQNNLEHMLGDPAPEIQCDAWLNTGPEGEELSLEQLRGKVVVLTLWGGFDTHGWTRHRINELNAIYSLLREVDDVAIIGVHDASIEPSEVARYVYQYGIKFPIGCDADPFLTFDLYNTNTIPQTVLIDQEGVLRHYKVNGRILELIKDLRRR